MLYQLSYEASLKADQERVQFIPGVIWNIEAFLGCEDHFY